MGNGAPSWQNHTRWDGIVFTSQSQVDDFPETYPGCAHIRGNVYITGPVLNLDSLKGLRFIGGGLTFFNTSLKTLSGLQGLRAVEGGLVVHNNTNLVSLSGLDSLESVGNTLNIYQNDSLADIGSIAGLSFLSNTFLRISDCPQLSFCTVSSLCQFISSGGNALVRDNAPGCDSKFQIARECDPASVCPSENIIVLGQNDLNDFVSLFPGCTHIPGSLSLLQADDTLVSLLPLIHLRSIGHSLNINFNSKLESLTGLDSLFYVGNGLTIHSNPRLKNLDGLGSLQWIGNIFQLVRNDSLSSLEGLGQIDPDSLHTLYFQFCPLLSACDHVSICQFLAGGGLAYLEGNASGCNNSFQVQKNCYPDLICPPGDLNFRFQEEVNEFHTLFPNCQALAGNLTIDGRNITGLDSLYVINSVNGNFYLANNDSLKHLNGLSGLQSIGLNFNIQNNPALLSLSGLNSLRQIGTGLVMDNNLLLQDLSSLTDSLLITNSDFYLRIFYNSVLEVCHVPAICLYLNQGGFADVEGNAPGCTSKNEILLFCNPDSNCPPGNIEIRSQQELDFFVQNYPDCNYLSGSLTISSELSPVTSLVSLSHLKSIGGSLTIEGNPLLPNLYGLDSLESIGGALSIGSNAGLESLEGLESLRIIRDYLAIYLNDSLLRLEGLDNLILDSLTYLYVYDCLQLRECNLPNFCSFLIREGRAVIRDNAPGCDNPFEVIKSCLPDEACPPGLQKIYNQRQLDEWVAAFPDCSELPGSLQIGPAEEEDPILSLSGLSKLRMIGGSLEINQNPWLKSLQGLDSLQRVGADLRIYSMDSLETLLPLMSLNLIGGQLYLRDNRSLTTLEGLDQFHADSLDALFIWFNEQLALCSNTAICAYLASGKSAVISDNATGCSSTMAVRLGCGVFCSQDFFEFFSQEDIDAFPANNPGCQDIDGYIYISGPDITNLDSLGQIRSIGGDLDISFNPILTNLDGLSALQSIGGYLGVYSNNLLDNIDALGQIDHGGITELYIQANPRLAVCNTPVICAFLNDETKAPYAYVNDNKPGCNNTSEIKTACGLANCPEGNLTLHTQAEVDSFRITYGDCAVLPGDLVINGLDITSLDSLSNLYSIGGQLIIENTSLENLQGLDHILYNTISHLVIRDNPTLSVWDVRAVCDYLSLSGNPSEISGNAEGCGTESEVRLSCSRTCFWDGVSFTSQAQVDSFRVLYGNCELIPHAVTISGTGISRLDSFFNLKKIGRGLIILSTSVPDLDGLAALDSIGGSLDIRNNSQLVDINQLQNIRSIGSTLRIQSNSKLITLDGLEGISGVPFNLNIQSNSTLTSLSGLDSIRYVGNTLLVNSNSKLNSFSGLRSLNTVGFDCRLESNAMVTNFQGLEKLESVGNDLRILTNAGLRTAAGLSGLKNIGHHLRIENNAGLDSLSGFSVLETIGNNFQLINNDSLKNIHSLSSLRQIGQSLIIRNNDLLPSLKGLDQLEHEPLQYLTLENNPLLDLCNIRSVCLYLFDPVKPYSISGNAPACQTADQIHLSCSISLPVSLISFNASLDGEAALLQWETSPDLKPDFFIIEHSRDGDWFNPLDKMHSRQQPHLFTYRHAAPLGMNYYRLKLVFEGAKPVYSKTAGIRIKAKIWVHPNPTRGPLQIMVPDEKNVHVEVMDLSGRVVLYTTGSGLHEIDLSNQADGLYLISLLSSSGRRIFKIQKE